MTVVAVAGTTLMLVTGVLPTKTPMAEAASARLSVAKAPVPVTSSSPPRPPGVPAQNVPPSPDFLDSCAGSRYDDSPGCINAVVTAIDHARALEGVGGIILPENWGALSPAQQMFVATNLERTARGVSALGGMASALDQAAQAAAHQGTDPAPPGGFPWSTWGGNWAGALGNPLEALYFWMYDDGVGSSNVDCTPTNNSGCWGHRDNVLLDLACQPCLMGSGFAPNGWGGNPSWDELLVDTSGAPPLDFTWAEEVPFLPAAQGGSGLVAPAVGIASTPDGQGYWLASADGGVFSFGGAPFAGSMGATALVAPITGIASTRDGHGYWLVAADGGIFAFGDAPFYGSMGGRPLAAPVVGLAETPDGGGYWEVAADGGIFAFGDTGFDGSMGGQRLAAPVVGLASAPDGGGYWEVAADGGIFAFGDAPFLGSMGGTPLFRPMVGMSSTPDGRGYWLSAADGGIFAFGDAAFRGSTGGTVLNAPVVAMTAPSNSGYWLAAADGGIFSFGVPFHGSMG